MGTLKIGSCSDKKGITIEPNSVTFNGNGVRKIMYGTTEIWNKIRPLVPILTSDNGSDGGVASCFRGNASSSKAYIAFDGDTTKWMDMAYGGAVAITRCYIQYQFTVPTVVEKVMVFMPSARTAYKLHTADIQYSDDGSTWTTLDTINTTDAPFDTEVICDVNNETQTAALYWRLQAKTNANGNNLVLSEIQFYGYRSL